MEKDPKISVSDLNKSYRTNGSLLKALEEISLEIRENEFFCVIGPSGCGKTTLLRLIAGLEKPDTGKISISSPGAARKQLSFVFQQSLLFPWMTVRENVELGLKKTVPEQARARSEQYLSMTGLLKFADFYPHQLSGGMEKRAALARALAVEPDIILMDEPFAYQDAQTRDMLRNLLLELYHREKRTIIFVTHDIREAIILGSKIVVVSSSPGRIKNIVEVPFPYPRSVEKIIPTDAFHDVYWKVDAILKGEIERAVEKESLDILAKGHIMKSQRTIDNE
ncbi:MAG: ABC transporter ATP-binding protein [Candidatus Omnitrophica bacterium]|nr:ABC transporter ATP-binding protein [Candidatus Omnitrophota bacterium]MDD4013579.1 ABC transporter ATP-binding protein [Candidatus Omnitrophota bacterium]